jgi:hypothetical protein
MTIDAWLTAALADAERRGLPDLRRALENLAQATAALRQADFNDDAASEAAGSSDPSDAAGARR